MADFQAANLGTLLTHSPIYTEKESETAFLLGGIGTGNVSLGSRGQLMDWELYNKPGKGNRFPYSMFTLHTQHADEKHTCVLEAPVQPPYSAARGDLRDTAGLAHMQHSRMRAEYPFCCIDFTHDELPVEVSMEAYTPFIPLNADDSGIPGAIIRFRVVNRSQSDVFVSVAGSLANVTCPCDRNDYGYLVNAGKTRNEVRKETGLTGVYMTSEGFPPDHPFTGSLALCTTNPSCSMKPLFYKGNWRDGIQDFWDDFASDGKLQEVVADEAHCSKIRHEDGMNIAAIAPCKALTPGEEYAFEFIIAWCFPNRVRAWKQIVPKAGDVPIATIRNYYALRFDTAWKAASYLKEQMPRLERDTLLFHKAFFNSTYPSYVLDALSANLTVLRSQTCFRIENGTFMAWEGCNDQRGSCDGTCTHVWNYAQAIAFLFPELEISARYNEFGLETEPDGKMNFRSRKMLKDAPWEMPAAVDGQCGTIVRLYREWKISGDHKIIDDLGEQALKAMDYCIRQWDDDRDGILSGEQHNTYDIEFFGISSLANTMYYAALRAGEEIARALGHMDKAAEYERLRDLGAEKMDRALWNGSYYEQQIGEEELVTYKYQYGKGCLSDQVLGQFMAHVCGMGYILPQEHVKKAVYAVYQHNFKESLLHHVNAQRTYAVADEAGLLLCTWPSGGRPRFPFIYSDEVWTGIEYQVAAHLIWEGFVDEGLRIVEAVRSRYDGRRRNPFDEVECGHHYARSLACWAVLIALSGYEMDGRKGMRTFAPKVHPESFQTFYSDGKEWGVYWQSQDEQGATTSGVDVYYRVEQ